MSVPSKSNRTAAGRLRGWDRLARALLYISESYRRGKTPDAATGHNGSKDWTRRDTEYRFCAPETPYLVAQSLAAGAPKRR
jgi:hypothetical protein